MAWHVATPVHTLQRCGPGISHLGRIRCFTVLSQAVSSWTLSSPPDAAHAFAVTLNVRWGTSRPAGFEMKVAGWGDWNGRGNGRKRSVAPRGYRLLGQPTILLSVPRVGGHPFTHGEDLVPLSCYWVFSSDRLIARGNSDHTIPYSTTGSSLKPPDSGG